MSSFFILGNNLILMIEVKIGQHRDKRNPQPDGSPKTKKLMNSFETWMNKK